MTRWRRPAAAVLAGGLLLALAGCPVGDPDRSPEPSAADLGPARPTDPSTDLPPYTGPPADGPPSAGPLARVRAAVDLTSATPGTFARVVAAVAAPDGGAFALLSPVDRTLPQTLVSLRGDAVAGTVPLPRVDDVWGMHLLDDGTVVVTGRLPGEGYGLRVVDPVTGAVRTTVVLSAGDDVRSSTGGSALGTQSRLFLLLSVTTDGGVREALLAVDVATGRVLAERDLDEDVAAVSAHPVGDQLAGLLPRPAGGVTVVFDASPTEVPEDRIPTLARYDADLQPAGRAARATDLSEGAETQSVAGAADGTVFLLAAVDEGSWLLAVPDGGGAGPLLAQLDDRVYGYALVVEPAQVWAGLPSPVGVRPVDLTTGEALRPVGFGCFRKLDVRALYPAATGALAIGECDSPREDTQMLWFLEP
ncbi:hypothetical protein ACI78T_14000 [Blastococcus sp. SYSU D00922]